MHSVYNGTTSEVRPTMLYTATCGSVKQCVFPPVCLLLCWVGEKGLAYVYSTKCCFSMCYFARRHIGLSSEVVPPSE